MNQKFEINRTKIKGGCQSVRKVVPHDSKSDLPLIPTHLCFERVTVSKSESWLLETNKKRTSFPVRLLLFVSYNGYLKSNKIEHKC